jgi:hypothetical protein
MRAPQYEACLVMIEFCEALPACRLMAIAAFACKLTLMFIGMAPGALDRETQIGTTAVHSRQTLDIWGRDEIWPMAFPAFEGSVLALEHVSGAAVVKRRHRRVPMDKVKISAAMVRVTGCTGSAGPVVSHQAGVQASSRVNPCADFLMAVQALVFHVPFHHAMAFHAQDCTFERTVSLCEFSRRDLGIGAQYTEQERQYCSEGQPDEILHTRPPTVTVLQVEAKAVDSEAAAGSLRPKAAR